MLLHIAVVVLAASCVPALVTAHVGGCVDYNSVCSYETFASCRQNKMLRHNCPCLCRIPPTKAIENSESKNYLNKCCKARGMTDSCLGICSEDVVKNLSFQEILKYTPVCTPPQDGNIWLECASTNRNIQKCCNVDLGDGVIWDEPNCREICQGRHPGRQGASLCFLSKFNALKRCLLEWDDDKDD